MKWLAIATFIFSGLAVADFETNTEDGKSNFKVFDESIKSDKAFKNWVFFYTRTSTSKGNGEVDTSVRQNSFNCETKFSTSRQNEYSSFYAATWTLPDSVGRAMGEYACDFNKVMTMKPSKNKK